MATDHVASLETDATPEGEAYISPTADFLLLATLTTAVGLACAAVITP